MDPENFPFVLLGNKIDMGEDKRAVSFSTSYPFRIFIDDLFLM